MIRREAHARALATSSLVLVLAVTARAYTQTDSTQYVNVGLRGGVISAPSFGFGPLIGGALHYHVSPAWRVGTYFEWVELKSGSSDRQVHYEEFFQAYRFGARGEWHVRPEVVVDPWVGLALGAFTREDPDSVDKMRTGGRWGIDVEFDGGLDFHIGRVFTVGILFVLVVPFGAVRYKEDSTALGAYFSYPLLPLLRLGATF
jgi:hypothetical protein